MAQEAIAKAKHGRSETRTVWALSSADLNGYVGSSGSVGKPWPGVAQVCRIQRVVRQKERKTGTLETTAELDYSITSLDDQRADAAAVLKRWRVHWHIENGLHWVRDVTLREDESQIHKGQAPEVFTLLRNAAVSLARAAQQCSEAAQLPSTAAAIRDLGARPQAVFEFFGDLAHRLNSPQQERVFQKPSPSRPVSTPELVTAGPQPPPTSVRARDRP